MAAVEALIFDHVAHKLNNEPKLTEDAIEDLYGLFGEDIVDALVLMKRSSFEMLLAPSSRYIFRVRNPDQKSNTFVEFNYCLLIGNHCNCSMFNMECCLEDSSLWCRHLIAGKLALTMKWYKIEKIDEDKYQELIGKIMKF